MSTSLQPLAVPYPYSKRQKGRPHIAQTDLMLRASVMNQRLGRAQETRAA